MSQIWSRMYDAVLRASAHRHAPYWLAVMAAAEAIFFPIPVDVMLAPMVLALPAAWVRYAAITTVFSVLGGVVGFMLGAFLIDAIMPLLERFHYVGAYETSVSWFASWGFLAVFLAGFTPIPFKVFTIAAGAAGMNLGLFILAALVSRGARFFLVALLVYWCGPKVEPHLKRYIDRIGWATVLLIAIGLLAYYSL